MKARDAAGAGLLSLAFFVLGGMCARRAASWRGAAGSAMATPQCNPAAHHRRSATPWRRHRMGDVPQSRLPALDALELQCYRPCARNALPKHRDGETLRLRRLRLKAYRRVTGLARA